MSDVVKLKVVEPPAPDSRLRERFEEAIANAKKFFDEHPNAGFGIVAYARDPDGRGFASGAEYYCSDPMDSYILPELAKARFINCRDD